jgi:hypothetical protein
LNLVTDFFIPKGYSLVLKITLSQSFTEEITTQHSDEKRNLLYAKVNSVNGIAA